MKNTTFAPSNLQRAQVINMHNDINGENRIVDIPNGCVFENFPETHKLAGAGLVSTLDDYINFANMLLRKV